MIKKFFHFICVVIFGLLINAFLGMIYVVCFLKLYSINLLSTDTYIKFIQFWNNGGVLRFTDILCILVILSYFPLCFYVWHKLNHYAFINLIIKPISFISNIGTGKYAGGMAETNLKNLKIEEKKTLEQIVKERIELEDKKHENDDTGKFRQQIIEKIENKIN